MKFINIEPGGKLAPDAATAAKDDTSVDVSAKATGGTTMGMLIDSIYAGVWAYEIDDFWATPNCELQQTTPGPRERRPVAGEVRAPMPAA